MTNTNRTDDAPARIRKGDTIVDASTTGPARLMVVVRIDRTFIELQEPRFVELGHARGIDPFEAVTHRLFFQRLEKGLYRMAA